MSEPFIGDITIFAGNFAPRGWAFCHGQLLAISSNDALFSLLGTMYGGDGRTTFGLPDLRGRVPVHRGSNSATGTTYNQASKGGQESVTLTAQQMPVHQHALAATSAAANAGAGPSGSLLATATVPLYGNGPSAPMAAGAVPNAGGNQSHDNMAPSLALNYIIALFGVYPSRN